MLPFQPLLGGLRVPPALPESAGYGIVGGDYRIIFIVPDDESTVGLRAHVDELIGGSSWSELDTKDLSDDTSNHYISVLEVTAPKSFRVRFSRYGISNDGISFVADPGSSALEAPTDDLGPLATQVTVYPAHANTDGRTQVANGDPHDWQEEEQTWMSDGSLSPIVLTFGFDVSIGGWHRSRHEDGSNVSQWSHSW